MYTATGNCGSVAGTYFYPSSEAPQFRKEHYLCFAMSLATAVLAFTNPLLLGRVNRARDEGWTSCWEERQFEVLELSCFQVSFDDMLITHDMSKWRCKTEGYLIHRFKITQLLSQCNSVTMKFECVYH